MGTVAQPEPWEKQEQETAKAFAAFQTYRDMGPSRSIAKAMQLAGASPQNVRVWENWSKEHGWVRRALAWDKEIDRTLREAELETRKEMARRQAEDAQALQDMLREVREAMLADMRPQDWVNAWKTAVTIERLARGEPTENVKSEQTGTLNVNGQPNITSAVYMDEDAIRLACALSAKLDESTSRTTDASGPSEIREPGPVETRETP